MSKNTKTVSVTLPLWVVEFYDRHQWEVEVPRPKLMREVLVGYAKARTGPATVSWSLHRSFSAVCDSMGYEWNYHS